MANILAIDDEASILEIIKIGVEKDGHLVTVIDDPEKLLEKNLHFYDLILLDVMMPKKDGYHVLQEIRKMTDNPIIFLTALATETSITYGLGLGADDYLTKPFRITELRARINAHLRRENREHHITLNIGAFRFDLAQKVFYFHDQLVILTKGEYEICEYLGQNKQCIYSREQIYEAVFGYDAGGDSQSIATHIKNIRQKFANPDDCPIKTKWGVGYLWQ